MALFVRGKGERFYHRTLWCCQTLPILDTLQKNKFFAGERRYSHQYQKTKGLKYPCKIDLENNVVMPKAKVPFQDIQGWCLHEFYHPFMVILELILELFIHGFTTFTLIQNQQQKMRYCSHSFETEPNLILLIPNTPITWSQLFVNPLLNHGLWVVFFMAGGRDYRSPSWAMSAKLDHSAA